MVKKKQPTEKVQGMAALTMNRNNRREPTSKSRLHDPCADQITESIRNLSLTHSLPNDDMFSILGKSAIRRTSGVASHLSTPPKYPGDGILALLLSSAKVVRQRVGSDQKEAIYQEMWGMELMRLGFKVIQEHQYTYRYLEKSDKSTQTEYFARRAKRPDMIVKKDGFLPLLVELKAVPKLLPEHFKQVLGYHEHTGIVSCLLVNFRTDPPDIRKLLEDRQTFGVVKDIRYAKKEDVSTKQGIGNLKKLSGFGPASRSLPHLPTSLNPKIKTKVRDNADKIPIKTSATKQNDTPKFPSPLPQRKNGVTHRFMSPTSAKKMRDANRPLGLTKRLNLKHPDPTTCGKTSTKF